MKKYLNDYGEKLNTFKLHLKTKYNLSDSTIEDYCKRIITICREEKIDIDYLNENIEKICYDYSEGDKKELGARSHNSYKSALKKYFQFIHKNGITNSNSINNTINYTIEAKKYCKHIALIELKNKQGKTINAEMLKNEDKTKFNKEFFKICYNLAIDELLNSNFDEFNNFLNKIGIQIYLYEDDKSNLNYHKCESEFDEKTWREEMKKIQDEAPWK